MAGRQGTSDDISVPSIRRRQTQARWKAYNGFQRHATRQKSRIDSRKTVRQSKEENAHRKIDTRMKDSTIMLKLW